VIALTRAIGFGAAGRGVVAGIFAKRAFQDLFGEIGLELDDDLRARGDVNIDGLAMHELDRGASHSSGNFEIVGPVGHLNRGRIGDERIDPDH
jgi:hypothetical protein